MPFRTSTNSLDNPMLQLADAMPQLVFMADAQGRVTYFNSRIHEYSGAHQLADGSWEWQGIIHPEDAGNTALTWMQCLATGLPFESEHRMQLADGSFCWHLTRALPQRDAAGDISHWFGTATNIHRQKAAEQTLRESEERFRLLTNSIPQIVWIVDAGGNTEYVNDRWYTYTGQDDESVGREGRISMMHPDDLPVVLDLWQMAQQQVVPVQWEYRLRNVHTDRYRWFSAQVLPLKDEAGRLVKWICAASDIQSHKDNAGLLEQEVAEQTRTLKALNETLSRQASELLRSNDDLQQFAHVASHDLKEPLRKIRTFVSRLQQEFGDDLPAPGPDYLSRIETSAARMTQMIDGVLHYSVADHLEDRDVKVVDLTETLENVVSDLELQVQKTGAQLHIDALPQLNGVPVLLHQLFFNLVNNALKFGRPGEAPRVRITSRTATSVEIQEQHLHRKQAYAVISVADSGIGFDPAYTDSIFKTFTRLHPKDRYEGTGLGLALCQKIVHRHGGAIAASSAPGAGATFTVYLPLAQE
ncbi:PAS domain-containing sensor histidine kinase [Flaviaesturariibacter flavus]|uniref:histidine kinase n=1 Tax=Flaviaesturariibacter flavus TaxID=2502780 RepID=A0A4R1B945_9BACT|nr:PAS domain-containing sensor histidine kinase [Flaviaesturariibacter flavus]TCJ13133.1 PAS domain-containing sensor histidine kinase [Flaviaesturariibacter flavus]